VRSASCVSSPLGFYAFVRRKNEQKMQIYKNTLNISKNILAYVLTKCFFGCIMYKMDFYALRAQMMQGRKHDFERKQFRYGRNDKKR
jgi:hypothetical protein